MTEHTDAAVLPFRFDRPSNIPFTVGSTRGGREIWSMSGDEVLGVFREAINGSPIHYNQAWHGTRIQRDFSSDKTQVALLHHIDTLRLAGFTYAFPADSHVGPRIRRIHMDEARELGLTEEEFSQLFSRSAEFGWTCIVPSEQNKGGWSAMMESMEDALRTAGYTHSVRYVKQADNYADNIGRYYDERIMYARDFTVTSEDGASRIPYTYFHILL